jgi:hypothetical protein
LSRSFKAKSAIFGFAIAALLRLGAKATGLPDDLAPAERAFGRARCIAETTPPAAMHAQ